MTILMVRFEMEKGEDDTNPLLEELEKFVKKKKRVSMSVLFGASRPEEVAVVGPVREILKHLIEYKDLKVPGYAPLEYTQEGISESISRERSVVSRHLHGLKEKKLVRVKTLNIIGDARKRKTYFLTPLGKVLLDAGTSQDEG